MQAQKPKKTAKESKSQPAKSKQPEPSKLIKEESKSKIETN